MPAEEAYRKCSIAENRGSETAPIQQNHGETSPSLAAWKFSDFLREMVGVQGFEPWTR